MKSRIRIALLPLVGALALVTGCAVNKPFTWDRVGSGDANLSEDIARCEYEAAAHTQVDNSFRSGLGQELDRQIRQRDLGIMCMRSKGWVQRFS